MFSCVSWESKPGTRSLYLLIFRRMNCNDLDYFTFTNIQKLQSTILNSKVSKKIRDQGETLFCWAFAISTMLRQSLNLFISNFDDNLFNKNDALKKLNSVDFHRQLRNELIMIPIPKNISNEFNQYSALNQGHYLDLAFERVNRTLLKINLRLKLRPKG